MREKRWPAGATCRECPTCRKSFKPMTDAQWQVNYYQHCLMSVKHQQSLKLKSQHGSQRST